MTEKLYEVNAYTSEFTAKVLDCIQDDGFYKVVVDKTAFFPEGGGQAADTGTLDGIRVFDVQIKDNVIYHYVDKPFETGSVIEGKLDFVRRFNFMQNHTGEHIVSGIAHKLFGVNNVGFHLGEELVTLDFDKELTREQLNEIEYAANQKVWQNLAVKAYFPSVEELKNTDYRSKKEIVGAVRLVQIEDTDICACCAPHVSLTGEIGIIKLLDTEKMRGGIRIVLKCGGFALQDYRSKFENIATIAEMFSAKQDSAAQAVKKFDEKFSLLNQKVSELKNKIVDLTIKNISCDENCVFVDDFEMKDLQIVADRLHKLHGGIRAVFSGSDENYSFAVCGNNSELQEFFAKFKQQFSVRGGGRDGMVQGNINATKENIKLFF